MPIQLCEDEGTYFSLALLILLHERFVDDIMSGAHELLEALQKQMQLIELLKKVKLMAHKWSSNTPKLLECISPENHGFAWTAPLSENDSIKVLGISWNPTLDSFTFQTSIEPLNKVTKLTVLSLISKLFDPMGWISPIIIVEKIIMQDMWHYNYS